MNNLNPSRILSDDHPLLQKRYIQFQHSQPDNRWSFANDEPVVALETSRAERYFAIFLLAATAIVWGTILAVSLLVRLVTFGVQKT
jgi:hypothetical protein